VYCLQKIYHLRLLLGTPTSPPSLCHFIPLGMSENQEYLRFLGGVAGNEYMSDAGRIRALKK
jgi:hypothetical protein